MRRVSPSSFCVVLGLGWLCKGPNLGYCFQLSLVWDLSIWKEESSSQMLSNFVRDAGRVEVFVTRWRMAVLPGAGLACVQL